jgi:hypothetical protein
MKSKPPRSIRRQRYLASVLFGAAGEDCVSRAHPGHKIAQGTAIDLNAEEIMFAPAHKSLEGEVCQA